MERGRRRGGEAGRCKREGAGVYVVFLYVYLYTFLRSEYQLNQLYIYNRTVLLEQDSFGNSISLLQAYIS